MLNMSAINTQCPQPMVEDSDDEIDVLSGKFLLCIIVILCYCIILLGER